MSIFKSHFWYNKSQRNGIFLLVLLIIVFQSIIVFVDFSSDVMVSTETPKVLAFQHKIDSLRKVEIENRKPKITPFNPNYITDFKGEQLGMSLEEIDRLLAFRKTSKFINSKKEFQQITKVSDSLLDKISPHFKFPDWVVQKNQNKYSNQNVISSGVEESRKPKYKLTTNDINKATAQDFQTINGIGPAFSKRIIKYRSKLQGFSFQNQLYEVWGLEKQVADSVLETFKIFDKPKIKTQNINTITFKQLLKNPYIDYELCKKIFNYRDEVAEIQNISELKNIKGFPLDKYDRIVLYLVAE
ncbi:helix-hairpin-helix domain-containing protein [Polaribacter batillariae]|uniref:Helix-hairpin-helix domain-containing protein n=1 Tax=Polaribacter batillariae TaxID=2808900 RepID=A0ABX7SW78_9FLAO|nr:helix-hairpin-helix domain-containing protein [Polaribacter batillariae]QTD37231.1 helix-hairpin-helix domain-containing protein [Polaribacter batillariae]